MMASTPTFRLADRHMAQNQTPPFRMGVSLMNGAWLELLKHLGFIAWFHLHVELWPCKAALGVERKKERLRTGLGVVG
jgi:hypothetical protein